MSEFILLALLAPLALFPSPARFAALLVIPALWAWRWLRPAPGAPRAFVPRTPLDAAVLLLLGAVLVGVFATRDLPAGLSKIAGVLYGVGVYYGVVRACRGSRAESGLWAGAGTFLLAGAGVAVLALLGTQWPVKFAFLDALLALLPARLAGLPGAEPGFSPNQVAGALLWFIPPTVALAAAALRRPAALRSLLGASGARLALPALGGLAALMLAVLFLTQSRAGLVACVLAFGAMSLFALRPRPLWIVSGLGAGLAAAGLALFAVGPLRFLQFVTGLGSAAGRPASLYTVEGRVELWARAIFAIQDFPFTGLGLNIFRLFVHALYPMYLVAPGEDVAHAHNLWLQTAVDLGLPGLVAYLGLWFGAAAILAGLLRAAELGVLERALVIGLAGGLLAHALFGLTDAVALGARPGVLWWFLLGLIAGLHGLRRAARTPHG